MLDSTTNEHEMRKLGAFHYQNLELVVEEALHKLLTQPKIPFLEWRHYLPESSGVYMQFYEGDGLHYFGKSSRDTITSKRTLRGRFLDHEKYKRDRIGYDLSKLSFTFVATEGGLEAAIEAALLCRIKSKWNGCGGGGRRNGLPDRYQNAFELAHPKIGSAITTATVFSECFG